MMNPVCAVSNTVPDTMSPEEIALVPPEYGTSFRLHNHDCDRSQHLKIKTLCDFFNDVAELHTFGQRCNVDALFKRNLTWMLRRIHIFLPDMPVCGEDVWVKSWNPAFSGLLIPRLHKASVKGETGETERLCAYSYADWMLINLETRRPERLFPWMYEMAGRHKEDLPFTPSLFSRAENKSGLVPGQGGLAVEPLRTADFKARYSDIDFNGHVTQSVYLQWMMDAHSFDFREGHVLREIEIIYGHEVKPDAAVRVEIYGGGEDMAVFGYRVMSSDGAVQYAWAKGVFALI